MNTIRVFIFSNNAFLSEALTRVIGRETDLLVVGDRLHSADLLRDVARSECDVLLADTHISGLNATLISDLRSSSPHLKVIALDIRPNESEFFKSSESGIARVSKDAGVGELIQAVRAAASERFFSLPGDKSPLDIHP